MAYPDAEISCLTLATDDIPKAWETEKRMLKARMVYDSETAGVDTYHSLQSYEDDEIMDIKYLNSLKKEAKRLIEQIAIAEEWNDLARIDVLKEELEQVTTYLSKHTQTNGKSRKLPNEFTKPKEAVKKSINRAINIIGQQDEELIIHLKQQIRIGKTCCYRSLPSVDVTVMRF